MISLLITSPILTRENLFETFVLYECMIAGERAFVNISEHIFRTYFPNICLQLSPACAILSKEKDLNSVHLHIKIFPVSVTPAADEFIQEVIYGLRKH